MPNTIPARAPLGASTTNRKWYLDAYDPATQIVTGVFGLSEFKFKPASGSAQDNSDFDGGGWKSQTVTALEWGGEGKLQRKVTTANATAYDPGQEILRKAARLIGSRVKVRVYEMEPSGPRVEAYEGWIVPTWDEDGGGIEALDTVSFTLLGQGKPIEITHPEGAVAVPVIASVLPAGAVAASTVAIEGAYFTGTAGATGVKFGATNATSYNVLSDGTILAVVPAGAAGPTTVTVGLSAPVAYTRGA